MPKRKDKPVIEKDIHQFLLEESEKSRLVRDITLELQSPSFRDFFAQFDEESVKQFIQTYSIKKAQYLRFGPEYITLQEQTHNDEVANAMERIWEIQQKKLFNLQCLWRAERIHFPGVEVCFDFRYWEKNISECPFLDAVTSEEVDLYIEYIHSDFFCEPNPLNHWQDYEGFRKEVNEENHTPLPAWYSFYDSRMGTDELLYMEDIRGEKEHYYISYNKSKSNLGWVRPDVEVSLQKPKLNLYEAGVLQDFIRRFESRKMLDLFFVYETELRKRTEYKTVEAAIEVLKNANERIPMDASSDWQTAILQAAWKYEKKQAESHIRRAFQEYQLRAESGISHIPSKWAIQEELFADRLYNSKQAILQGRKALGEPKNFDF